ncbi:MAG: hypothetical protein J6Q99_03515, partial [Oscillospiraceae bacterium]|nr:hypothetical protein [Oscillospiraceae bacterium]
DLLGQIDQQEDNSLEGVIGRTVDSALVYNTDLTSPLVQGATLSDVAALNRTVTENNIEPAVVFNENIQTRAAGSDMLGAALPQSQQEDEPQLLAYGEEDTGSTYALPNAPTQVANNNAYYYAYIDNSWQFVGQMTFEVENYRDGNKNRRRATESLANILALYTNAENGLGSVITQNELNLRWSFNLSDSYTTASKDDGYAIFGDNYTNNSTNATRPRYVRLTTGNGQPLSFYTVTLNRLDGTTEVIYVRSGGSTRLPSDCSWVDSSGDEYEGGANITNITSARVFTEVTNDPRLQIKYDVNFPTVQDVTVATKPTLQGQASSTITDFVEDGDSAYIRSVSQREVKGTIRNSTNSRMIRFKGWQVVGTDHIIEPGNTLSYADLLGYVQSGRVLNLRGVWEHNALQTASFYVRYDSRAADSQTGGIGSYDSSYYTNEIFAAFVEGIDTSKDSSWQSRYNIADTSADNSYGADMAIRNLLGAGLDLEGQQKEIWLTSFPDDQYVFDRLKLEQKGNLTVGGEVVDPNELDADHYTSRWYVFKSQSDAWHIDGRLVKKEGLFDVTKTFAGNKVAVAEAKNGFYITAQNNETGGEKYYLYINEPATKPGDGKVLTPKSQNGDTYLWTISGTEYGDNWTIAEHPSEGKNTIVHSSYRVVDIYGDQSTAGTGSSINLMASTVATDMYSWQALTIEFTNIYHNTDSIIIKKEDKLTGSPIGGAVFQLIQNDKVLWFTYDTDTDSYLYDPSPGSDAVDRLAVSQSGYYELNIQGFSYEDGSIVVKELQAPEGYTPIENIEIGYPVLQTAMMSLAPAPEEVEEQPPEDTGQTDPENTGQTETEDTGPPEEAEQTDPEEPQQPEAEPTQPVEPAAQVADEQQALMTAAAEPALVQLEPVDETQEPLPEEENPPAQQDPEEPVQEEETPIEEEPEPEEGLHKLLMGTQTEEEITEIAPLALDIEAGVQMLSNSPMASYNNGLLIVQNSTENTSVTVNKKWECSAEDRSDVTVQLMANDAPVTALVSGVELTKLLTAENGYSATWENLPLYANGEKIVWSVKEIKIGSEHCLPNYTFINWVVDYGPATYTYDSEGRLANTSFTITNVGHRTMLRLIKTNLGGGIRLKDATFTLEYLLDGQPDPDFVMKTETTDADGVITFHNLKYGDYRLIETESPSGYEKLEDPIYLTIRNDGSVVVQDHQFAQPGASAYTIQVLNEMPRPLPATGGAGTTRMVAGGLMLFAASAAAALFRKKTGCRASER